MLRRITAVVVLSTVTWAQTPSLDEQIAPQQTSSSQSHMATAYQSLTTLRRGSDETIAVIIEGAPFVASPRSPVTGVVAINLQLDPSDNFTFGTVEYPKPFKHKFRAFEAPIPVFEFPYRQPRFKLRAKPSAALGMHMLKAKISFQAVSDSGLADVEQISLEIPVTVTDERTEVRRTSYFPSDDHISRWGDMPLGLRIVLVPLLPLLAMAAGIACLARGQDCTC